MKKTQNTIFYSIERTIKKYRHYSITKINEVVPNITLDQSMLLKELLDKPDATQTDLSTFLFKDSASVSRMIELLVRKKLLKRKINRQNRRRNILVVNKEGIDMMDAITEVVKKNRKAALKGISAEELDSCRATLDKIFNNLRIV